MWWEVVRPQMNRLDNIDEKLLNMDDELPREVRCSYRYNFRITATAHRTRNKHRSSIRGLRGFRTPRRCEGGTGLLRRPHYGANP